MGIMLTHLVIYKRNKHFKVTVVYKSKTYSVTVVFKNTLYSAHHHMLSIVTVVNKNNFLQHKVTFQIV